MATEVDWEGTEDQAKAWVEAARLMTEAERSHDIVLRQINGIAARALFVVFGWPDWWTRIERLEMDTHAMVQQRKDPLRW